MRRTVISVDLDDLTCYHQIYGLPAPRARESILLHALPRFLELFERTGTRATFFVIGRTLHRATDAAAAMLESALAAGHELGNHSFAHAYDLTRRGLSAMADDLALCDVHLRELGASPVGFRAPGYTSDGRLRGVVRDLGYLYDSSSLPSPPYYGIKLAALAALAARGRRSSALWTSPAAFFGSRQPHRDSNGLWHVPVSASPVLRLPMVGTFVLSGPQPLRSRLVAFGRRAGYLHLELHGLDLADPERDGIDGALVASAPELRVPLTTRLARLESILIHRGGGGYIADFLGGGPSDSRLATDDDLR